MNELPENDEGKSENQEATLPAVTQTEQPLPISPAHAAGHRQHTWIEKVAVAFAAIAAFAGAWQGWVERDSEKRQLRAYVYAIPSIQNFVVGQTPLAEITLKNGGQTPAYNPALNMAVGLVPYPNKIPFYSFGGTRPPEFSKRGGGDFIYQDHTKIFSAPINQGGPLNQSTYDEVVVKKDYQIELFGSVTYLD